MPSEDPTSTGIDILLEKLGLAERGKDERANPYRRLLKKVIGYADGRSAIDGETLDQIFIHNPDLKHGHPARQLRILLNRLQAIGWQCAIPTEAVPTKSLRDLAIPASPAALETAHQLDRLEHLLRREWTTHTKDPNGALFLAALLLVTRCGASGDVAIGIASRLRRMDVDQIEPVSGRLRTPIHPAAPYDVHYEFRPPDPLRFLLVKQRKRMRKHGDDTLLFQEALGRTEGNAIELAEKAKTVINGYLKLLRSSPTYREHEIRLPHSWHRITREARSIGRRDGVAPAGLEVLASYPLPKNPDDLELWEQPDGPCAQRQAPDPDSNTYLPPEKAELDAPAKTNPPSVERELGDWPAAARNQLRYFFHRVETECISEKSGKIPTSRGTRFNSILGAALDAADQHAEHGRSLLHLALHWFAKKLHGEGLKLSSVKTYSGKVFRSALFDDPESLDLATWDDETVDGYTNLLLLAPERSEKTRHDTLVAWIQFLRFCADTNLVGLNRTELPYFRDDGSIAARPGRRTIITPFQYDQLLEHIDEIKTLSPDGRLETKAVLTLGFYGGLRASEVLNLTAQDFVWVPSTSSDVDDHLAILVQRGKTRFSRRAIPLHRILPPNARAIMEAWHRYRHHQAMVEAKRKPWTAIPLFGPLVSDRRPSWDEVIHRPLQILRECLRTNIDFHGLRHSAASWVILRSYAAFQPDFVETLAHQGHAIFQPEDLARLRALFTHFETKASHPDEKILFVIARYLGHSNIRTLMLTYAHTLGPIHSHALKLASTFQPHLNRIKVPK